ncbi:MAG: aminopeptidase, partial [Lachnospiraceae bacterium]|nr:aminopeptidase [Lachnospiraceae bacterium]
MEIKNAWTKYPAGAKRDEVMNFAEGYKDFISNCKSERECTSYIKAMAEKDGFKDLEELIKNGTPLKAGDRVYRV